MAMDERPTRILLVEEDAKDRRLLQELLTAALSPPCDLATIGSTDQALARLRIAPFDLVLLGFELPDERGLEAVEAIRSQAPGTPIIVFAGLGDQAQAISVLRAGAQDYLVKGRFDAALLEKTVRYAIERHKAEAGLQTHLTEITLLHRVSTQIASAPSLAEALQSICAELSQFLRVPQAGFALLDPAHATAEVVADHHPEGSSSAMGAKIPVTGNPSMEYILEERAPLAVTDAQADPRLSPVQQIMRQRGVRSILLVPVMAEGEIIGTLGFDAYEPREFSKADIRLVQQAANQAGQLLKRKQAEDGLVRRARQMEALYKTSLEIGTQPDLPALLNAIVPRAAELLGIHMGGLYLALPTRNVLELVVSYNLPGDPLGTELQLGEGLAGRVAEAGEPLMVPDYQSWLGRAAAYAGDPFHRALGVPLRLGDRIIGVLSLIDHQQTGLFEEEEIRLASMFADQAAIAVENARLLQSEQQGSVELSTLLEATRAASSTLDLDHVLQRIADQATRAIGASGCTVSRWDREADAVVTWIEHRADGDDPEDPGTTYPLDSFPATREVLENRQWRTVHVSDTKADTGELGHMRRSGVVSLLILPLAVGERAIGLVELDQTDREREYLPAEIRLAQAMADEAATAIENARLFEAERNAREQTEALREATHVLGRSLEVDDILRSILDQLRRVLVYDTASVLVMRDDGPPVLVVGGGYKDSARVSHEAGTALQQSPIIGRMMQDLEPVVSGDVRELEGWVWVAGAEHVRSWMGIPLESHGGLIGVLMADSSQAGFFGRDELRTAEALAQHAAQALENARLYQAERQARRQAETIQAATEALGNTLDLQQVLEMILRQLRHVVPYDSASVQQLAGNRLQIVGGHGFPNLEALLGFGFDLESDDNPNRRVWQTRVPCIVDDALAEYAVFREEPHAENNIRSWLGVPLLFGERFTGLIALDKDEAGFYTPRHAQLALSFAAQAAAALENARLFEETERLRAFSESIVQGVAEGIMLEDPEGRIVFINPAIEAMLQFRSSDLVGRHWSHIVPEDQLDRVRSESEVRSSHGESRYETVLQAKTGKRVPVMVSARPVFEGGEFTGVLSVFTDITERVRAERENEERRVYLERVLASAPDAIATMDAQHRLVEWNAGAERLFGYQRAEAIGRSIDELITNRSTVEEAADLTRQIVAGHDIPPMETVRYRKDGSPVDVLLAGSPIQVSGELVGVVAVYADVSERKQAELALRESENRLSGLLSSMTDLVFAFDENGRFTFYHASQDDDLFLPAEGFMGRTHAKVMPARVDRLFAAAVEKNKAGRATSFEYKLDWGGEVRWFSVNLSPIFAEGRYSGSVAVARNVTERQKADLELRKANRGLRMLSECNRVLSRATREAELLTDICRVVVDAGGYCMAWVGLAADSPDKRVRPVAQAGVEDGYLETLVVTWDESESGRGPTGTAIRTGAPSVARFLNSDPDYGPWRDEATRRGFASSVAVPLILDGSPFGALNVYAREADAFDSLELSLLAEMAGNLAYGIAALRTRADRRRAEQASQMQAERLGILREIDQAILEAQSPEAIAQSVLARIRQILPCRRASVTVFDLEAGVGRALATQVSGDTLIGAGTDIPLEHFGDLDGFRRGEVRTEPNISSSAHPAPASKRHSEAGATAIYAGAQSRGPLTPLEESLLGEGVRSYVSVPLMAGGELMGTLNLGFGNPASFSADQLEIVDEVAKPLAIAIQQARLHEQLQGHADGLEETVSQRTRELRAERDRTQAILESLGEAVVVTDVSGMVLYTNPATYRLTGYTSDEILGRSQRLWQDDSSSDAFYAQSEEGLVRGEPLQGETAHRRKDGALYDAAVTVAPLFDPDDPSQLIGSVCVQRDITPLKEAERFKDEFVSNVSHELRTPLSIITLISGNLDRLYEGLGDSSRKQMIQAIREYVSLLNDLIGDVLEISAIDSGRISHERQVVDLAQLRDEEIDRQRPLAAKKGQSLLGTGLETLAVQGNASQLRQAIRNLLNNAIKFTPQEGEITCDCSLQEGGVDLGMLWPGGAGLPPGRWARLSVIDSGIGMAAKDLPHLAERFYRLKTQDNVSGTGLGLAIARELVEFHDGHIAVASKLGEGSVFSIFLPLLEEES